MTRAMRKRLTIVTVLLITAIGAFFRLHDLGLSAFRADTIILWNLALARISPITLWTKWMESSGTMGQMPMPVVVMQAFLYFTGMEITPFSVRLPFALFGVATVPIAYFAGRAFGRRSFGLLFAALVAMSPFHVYFSREAYFYAPLFMGFVLYFWAALALGRKIWTRRVLRRKDAILLGIACFFCGYSQMTGLFICATGAVYFFGLLFLYQRKRASLKRNLLIIIGTYLVVFVPLMMTDWGPRQMLSQLSSGHSARSAKLVAMSGDTIFTAIPRVLVRLSWGTTPLALALTVLGIVCGVWGLWKLRSKKLFASLYFIVTQIALFAASRSVIGAGYDTRYQGGLWPFVLAILAYGLYSAPVQILRRRERAVLGRRIALVICFCAVLCSAYPSYFVTQLTGKPTPYRDIVAWSDSTLPKGTLVLVDRWFEPWNELKAHPTTNVFFTYTIPNEPVEVYRRHNWRGTAQGFFQRYPDAAYLEIAKSYQEVPDVGPWEWPRKYFKQHVAITNSAGVKLRELGVAARESFYPANTNRLVVEYFYDTREDIIAKARASRIPGFCLYGRGWKYTKTRDHRDWRVMDAEAELIVYNFLPEAIPVQILVKATAVNGAKRVECGGTEVTQTFQPGQVVEWRVGPLTLEPGENHLILRDSLWSLSKIPLLVADVRVQPIAPQAPEAANPTESHSSDESENAETSGNEETED